MLFELLAVAGGVALAAAAISLRVVKQYERALVFRFGRVLDQVRGPGLAMIVPIADRLHKVNMQIVTMAVPAQEGITRDNVTVKVDAVVYFRVIDPVRAIINVQDYPFAVSQVAQTSLRSVIGKSDLDDLLTNRERLNEGLELMIDNPAVEWGIHIDRVEIKDVALPETMKRSMSRQAEAERERRARVISTEGELNSTQVLPFPVDLLRYLENNSGLASAVSGARSAVEKLSTDSEHAATSEAPDPLSGPPEVAALEARGSDQQQEPNVRRTHRLTRVSRTSSAAKDTG
jgi:regulator of protease activity HflC (stomatin/prohibitin superfamily)